MPRRRSGKKIDFLHWTYGSGFFASLADGTPMAGTVIAAQHLPETLMRTRGEVAVNGVSGQVPGRACSIGVGMILVPEGTGATVLWSPITDGDAPWFWVDYFNIGYEEPVTDIMCIQALIGVRRVVDSKAMRINKNMELQLVGENQTTATALNVDVAFQARFLAGT